MEEYLTNATPVFLKAVKVDKNKKTETVRVKGHLWKSDDSLSILWMPQENAMV